MAYVDFSIASETLKCKSFKWSLAPQSYTQDNNMSAPEEPTHSAAGVTCIYIVLGIFN